MSPAAALCRLAPALALALALSRAGAGDGMAQGTDEPRFTTYMPFLDRMKADAVLETVAGNVVRVATAGRQVYLIQDGPPRLTALERGTDGVLRDLGSHALTAEALDPSTVRLVADAERDYAYLLYFNALTVIEGVRPPEPRKVVAAPDCDAVAQPDDPTALFLGCDGIRQIDIRDPDSAAETDYLFRAGRTQAIAEIGHGWGISAIREPSPATRPTSLLFWGRSDGLLNFGDGLLDAGSTVDIVFANGYAYQLTDQDGQSGIRTLGTEALQNTSDEGVSVGGKSDGHHTTDQTFFSIKGRLQRLAVDAEAGRLYLLSESVFDRRDRKEHGRTGVTVFDAKTSSPLVERRFITLDRPGVDMALAAGRLYVAMGAGGLRIWDVEGW